MTAEERLDDYEKSCEYATRVMREREITAGRLTENGEWKRPAPPKQEVMSL